MRVVLSYSGGLDTSAILLLLKEQGHSVITVTVDVGQEDELRDVEEKAYAMGAEKHYTVNAVEEFAGNIVSKAIKANALYEKRYPLGTALARPLIAEKVASIALDEGADAVAHGCTGKGNDQVRFDNVLLGLLDDDVEIIAPVRDLRLTREQSMGILSKHGFDPGVHGKYSIDENLWTRSIEGGEIDDPKQPPSEDAFQWTVAPEEAPDEPLLLEIGFKEGLPVSLNGSYLGLAEMIRRLNKLVGAHGYGRIDHIENRVVGLKSREVYEAPAALTLITAHEDLEKTVLTPRELRFKQIVDSWWTDLVYNGLWLEPLRQTLDSAIDSLNKYTSGSVKLKVYKGGLSVLGRWSDYSSYSPKVIDYDKGWYPTGEEASGYIKIYGLHSIAAVKAREQ